MKKNLDSNHVKNLSSFIKGMDENKHETFMSIKNYIGTLKHNNGMFDINSLRCVKLYLESLNPEKTIVFLDWDDTIVHSGTNDIIEPKHTKELIKYMLDKGIDFTIITGRFWKSVLFEENLNVTDIKNSTMETIYKPLENIGFVINPTYLDFNYIYENNDRVGIQYLNILFGSEKGRIIKSFIREKNYENVIFVDDYEPYIQNVKIFVPNSIILKRNK